MHVCVLVQYFQNGVTRKDIDTDAARNVGLVVVEEADSVPLLLASSLLME